MLYSSLFYFTGYHGRSGAGCCRVFSTSTSKENRVTLCSSSLFYLQDIMQDPVLAADGFSYEREAIEDWFAKGHRTSPKTGVYVFVGGVLVVYVCVCVCV